MSAPLLFAMLRAFDRASPQDLPPHHRLVLLALADFADEAGKAWPSAVTIAGRTGQSRSTVEALLDELEAAGWIAGERRHAGGRPLSTVFLVRTEGGPVSRVRPGRHTPRGGVSDTPPGTPCPPRHAPHAMPGGGHTPRGGIDTPPRGEDPIRDPINDPDTHTAGGREDIPRPAALPADPPRALERTVELDAQEPEPVPLEVTSNGVDTVNGSNSAVLHRRHPSSDPLIPFVAELAAEGNAYGVKIAERLARCEGLSAGIRRTLETMRGERTQARASPSGARGRDPDVQRGPSFLPAARAEALKPLPKGADEW